jgi:hypothetical protein
MCSLREDKHDDIKGTNGFKKMNELEKKEFLKKVFLKGDNFDPNSVN